MTDTTTTFNDYGSSDGWKDGMEVCPHCGLEYGGEGGYHNTVYDETGRKYEHFTDTEAGTGPFYCPECFKELDANRRANENESIERFL